MARPSSSYMQEAPPGYRWKTRSIPGSRPGTFTTERVLVPIVGPETTSQVLAGMGGQEDRLGALAGADRVPAQDVTTVIKEYADETPNTRTTTIKGGLLGGPMEAGAVHAGMPGVQPPPVDPRFQRWPTGQVPRMKDPNQLPAGAAGRNKPPEYYQHPAVQQQFAAKKRAEEMERRGWTQNRFHPDMRGIRTPLPGVRQPVRPVDTGSSIADARMAAIADANRIEAESARMPRPGAVHADMPGVRQPTPDLRFQPFLPGQDRKLDDPTWSRATAVNVPRVTNQLGTDFFGDGVTAPPPSAREQVVAAADQPVYVADDGTEVYLPDLISIGGMGRVKTLASLTKAAKKKYYEWVAKILKDRKIGGGYVGQAGKKRVPKRIKKWRTKTAMDRAEKARLEALRASGVGRITPKTVAAGAAGAAVLGGIAAQRSLLSEDEIAANIERRRTAPAGSYEDLRRKAQLSIAGKALPVAQARREKGDWAIADDPWVSEYIKEKPVLEVVESAIKDIAYPEFDKKAREDEAALRKLQQQQQFDRQVTEGGPSWGPASREAQQLPREVTEGGEGSFPATKVSDANQRADNPNLEKIWGKYAYDPKARRKFYLDNLKDIWRKALLMDVVANLTGGQSMSKRYLEMATGRLDAMEKFNEEERISNIWKDVFTDANGNFYMPKTKREAAERAGKTGARPAVIKDIFGSVPDVKKKAQYHRVDPKDPTKWENRRFESDEEPSEEWITGASRTQSPQLKDIFLIRLAKLQEMREAGLTKLADSYERMIGADEKGYKDLSPSRWSSILQGDIQGANPTIQLPEGQTATGFIMKWLTQPEVEYVDPNNPEGPKKKLPGYPSLSGRKATKEEIAEVTGATTDTETTTEKAGTEAPQGAIDALMANPTEEMKKMFKDKYGYLPEGI